jgi:hypothetical protein
LDRCFDLSLHPHTLVEDVFCPTRDPKHEALLVRIACVATLNKVFGDIGLYRIDTELVFFIGIGVVTLTIHSSGVTRDKMDVVTVESA